MFKEYRYYKRWMRAITRTTFVCLALFFAAVLTAAPRPAPAPALLPLDIVWTRPFPFGDSFLLVPAASRVLTVLPSRIDAYAWASTGDPLWTSALHATTTPVVHDGYVLVAADEQLQSLSEVSGFVQWRLPTGPISIAPAATAGWVVFAADDHRIWAVSAADGRVIWQTTVAASLTTPLAIDGDLMVGAFDDGIMRGWGIVDGVLRWSTPIGARPTQLLAAHQRVFVTSDNGRLVSLQQRDGRLLWSYRLDMPVAGRIAVDAARVYVATIDNSVRAHDYRGHQVWRQALPPPGRVVDGLFTDSGRVYVPQSNGEIRIFLAETGLKSGRVIAPPGDATVTAGLAAIGDGPTLRLALTRSEASARSVTLYQRVGIPATVAVTAPGRAVTLTPPALPVRR